MVIQQARLGIHANLSKIQVVPELLSKKQSVQCIKNNEQ